MRVQHSSFSIPKSGETANEDSVALRTFEHWTVAVVADGVGGAAFGGEAARKVTESLLLYFQFRPETWNLRRALEEFVKVVNRILYQESLGKSHRPEMLTTVAAITLEGRQLCGINVGDSRIYCLRGDKFWQLTTDHIHPAYPHVLTQALGLDAEVSLHSFELQVEPGDQILLCTDGLTRSLTDQEIKAQLKKRTPARAMAVAARESEQAVNDDVSCIVVEILEISDIETTPLEIPERLNAGDRIEGYELVRPLSENARTWVAKNEKQTIILKFPAVQAARQPEIRHQFHREIWGVTRLKSPFFIRAFVPPKTSTLCYAMDYIEAPNLKQWTESSPLSVEQARHLAAFLLDASQFLIGFDLAHGDIKPENVLVLQSGGALEFKLIDFGSISEIFSLTHRRGTPSYLAPERFHAAPVSESTEIYAIGATLYRCLTRQLPFGEIEPFQTPQFNAARKPTRWNQNIPPWFESILLRSVSPDPEARYRHYSEMKFDLEHPEQVRPFFPKEAPLLERNPLAFYRAGFFVLLALVVLLLVLVARK